MILLNAKLYLILFMNRTMDRLNHTTSLPKISEITDITNQNAYIPKKYKKIPKKIVR